jgi:hypothetical protein
MISKTEASMDCKLTKVDVFAYYSTGLLSISAILPALHRDFLAFVDI